MAATRTCRARPTGPLEEQLEALRAFWRSSTASYLAVPLGLSARSPGAP